MKRLLAPALAAVLLWFAAAALAEPRTVVLDVKNMTCPACPFAIKTALKRVGGVTSVDVSYETKEAVITFDDTKTTVEALTKATANAGFPSTLKGAR